MVKQTDAKPYLWSKTTVTYSDNNQTITYSVSYKGKDGTNGTSFTPKGTATGFFYNMSSVPSYEDGMDSDVYIVNVDDRSNPTSKLPPYVCHFEYENFIIEHAEFGDGYNVKGHLYVANSNEWVDFGEIQGAKGDPGDPGIDAINIVFSPAELVFDADENGNLKQAEKSADVKVFRGNKQLTYLTDWYFPNVGGKQPGDNCKATFMVEGNNSPLKPIVKIYDISSTKIEGTNPQASVPASSGGINVPIKVNDVTYNAYLSFAVNVNTFAHTLIQDNKKYISKYTEISNKYNTVTNELNGKASKDELREVSSSIEQTARRISLEVSSNAVGRRNLLVNSAFRNQDSVFIHSLAHIEKNTGVDSVNCIHSSDKYSGTGDGNFIGAFWDSTQKNGVVTNIPIRMGKKYVISCWIKSDNKALPFVIECFFMNSINQQNRGEDVVRKEYHVDNVNEWKRIDFVVDTTDTSEYASKVTPYLAVNFWSNTKNVPKATGATEYPTCHAYICQPMMEEGDKYGGWTLSEDDYEYVGGNILDNTRSLEKSGNLEKEESEIINEGYEYAYAVAHSNNTTSRDIEMLQWNVAGRINDGQDYMFSFLAKGTGMVSTYLRKDGTPRFFVESSNNKHNDVSSDGNVYFELTKEWKRYWVHYHLNTSSEHPLPEKLLIKCYGGNEVYICQPKLEIGATMTEFTERKTDLVDKASLKKAGIAITDREVLLYGEKVKVKNGNDEAAMFQDGKLNANLIDAKKIVAQGIDAKSVVAEGLRAGDIDAERATIRNLNIIGSSRNPYTRMSKDTNVDYSNNVSVITGTDGEIMTADYELKWDNSQNGRRITLLNYRWRNELSEGWGIINAPEGKYFFEDGIKKSTLSFSRQYIELLGIGDDIDFYGWIVVNKVDISTNFGYGHTAKVLAYGILYAREENGVLKLQLVQNTFDGKRITVEPVGDNGYKFTFPSYWGSASNFVPHITPYQFIGNIYVHEYSENYIIFRYSGRSSLDRNFEDASFYFSIQKRSDMTST